MTDLIQAIAAAAPSIAMLAIFALIAGGIWMIRTQHNARKGALMLVLAVVIFANVLITML